MQSQKVGSLKEAHKRLYESIDVDGKTCVPPSKRREEIMTIKAKLADYQEFKKTQTELGKRDRAIKNAWRHGITGMDNADSINSSIFYKDLKATKDF